jgi:sensor domain CHASE-containing protein
MLQGKKNFVCSKTWEVIREKKQVVLWSKLVWFPLAIPKQAFILWLAMKDMLITGYGVIKVMLSAGSVIISWKLDLIYFLSVASITEYGDFV